MALLGLLLSVTRLAFGTAALVGPSQLAVIVNTADPLSVAIGSYYAAKRHIPKANIVKVRFDDFQRDDIPLAEFNTLQSAIERQVSPRIQAYALTWARPYRVGCMSVTSALALGLHQEYCASSCAPTRPDPYFDTWDKPPGDFRLRPAMSVASLDFAHAKALIDRGVSSDGHPPRGTAYLVTTNDARRNVRATEYALGQRVAGTEFSFHVVAGPAPEDPADVMFYFTGAEVVQEIGHLRFLPGAVADHLTSFGGMLTDSSQMSALRWLEAGATGSYGTVVEPCAFRQKFPNVAVLMAHYLAGETLIESYWKSVQMPGQGLFIGEPLAAPFRAH